MFLAKKGLCILIIVTVCMCAAVLWEMGVNRDFLTGRNVPTEQQSSMDINNESDLETRETTTKSSEPSDRSAAPPQTVDGAQEPAIRDYHVIQSNPTNQPIAPGMPDDVKRVVGLRGALLNDSRAFKTILLWNSFREAIDFSFGLGHKPFVQHNCPVSACRVVTDRTLLKDAHAVVFHTRNIGLLQARQEFPTRANRKQLLAFYNLEAPIRIGHLLQRYNSVFNLTMTYKLDSDIPIRHVTLWPRPASEPYVPLTAADMAAKNKMAIWIISHCNKDGSQRWPYVQELKNFIDVDIFGLCGPGVCPKGDLCLIKAEQQYKFYLSLENSDCKDYVTEKLYRALSRNVIPIVHGGLDYDRELPPKSVIKLIDFKSPQHLADYLKYLDENDEEYMKYFEWKQHYVIEGISFSKKTAFCHLCQILHDDDYPARTNFDVFDWWNNEGNCTAMAGQARQLGLHV